VLRSVPMKWWIWNGLLLGSVLLACGAPSRGAGAAVESPDAAAPSSADDGGGGGHGGDGSRGAAPDGGGDAASSYDPFAPQPDTSGGLTNVSSDLNALLENGALAGACDKYDAGQTDHTTMLLCGKWKFFYDTFGTSGMPAALVQFLATNFPDELGLGFSKLGIIPDPTSSTNMPLGVAPTVPMSGNIAAVGLTCASCHFGQLPDGRYSVGAPNLRFDYARYILTISVAPGLAMGLSQPSAHDPAAVGEVQPVLDKLSNDSSLKTQLTATLLPLASLKMPAMTPTIEHDYTTWPTGTLDFLIAPLPVDDGVHIVGKMIGLWGIPTPDEVTATGMTSGLVSSGLLGWTGDSRALDEFLRGFAVIGAAASTPTSAEMDPLIEYIASLRAPSNPNPPDPTLVATGAALFQSKGCITCHDGPRGSGRRPYTFQEIGTDPTLEMWADPNLSGTTCCGVPPPIGGLTHGVKSPRLVGLWAIDRLLHDGELSSLDQLFCRGSGRPPVGVAPERTDGHMFTCDGLSDDEKQALIAYMLAH